MLSLLSDFFNLFYSVICVLLLIILVCYCKSLQSRYNFIDKKYHGEALTDSNIKSLYKQLSWRHTDIDFERIDWFNRIIKTFWPTIKTQLNKHVFNDLLKPSKVPSITKKLTKKKTKLSVYISCRRKMNDLCKLIKERNNSYNLLHESLKTSVIYIILFFIKLFFIYTRQFIMDYIGYLTKQKDKNKIDDLTIKEIHLKEETKELFAVKNCKKVLKLDKTNISNPFVASKKGVCKLSKQINLTKEKFNLKTPTSISSNKLMVNRLKLAKTFSQANNQIKNYNNTSNINNNNNNRELIVEKIKLGNSIPIINGVRCVENENNSIKRGAIDEKSCLNVPSDEKDMKFLVELEYNTDNKFLIQLNSIPILNRIVLDNLCIRIRILININHTTTELNKNLDIMDTPGDILFPAINYIQLTLVDAPKLDWNLSRVNERCDVVKKKFNSKLKILIPHFNQYLDPIHLINHNYFKYLIHSIIYLALRWFQPFDIKIGSNLFIKTSC